MPAHNVCGGAAAPCPDVLCKADQKNPPGQTLRRIFCCANIIFPKNSGRWESVAAVSAAFRAGKCGRGVVMYALCAGENDRSTGDVLVNDGERTGGLVIGGGALRFANGQNDLTVFHGIHAVDGAAVEKLL